MLANVAMRAAAFCTALGLLALGAFPATSAETRHAAIVIDANTGAVLHEQLADARRYPASLTKMMTLYLTFEEIEQGRLSYTSPVPVSARAAAAPPSKLKLTPGDEILLLDAIKALITKSANDVAIAVAEKIGGSEAAFVRRMNERARQMGMSATTFTNASGLPDSAQVTTARDMARLALRLVDDFPKHYRHFALQSFTYRGKVYRTHNTLLRAFPGADGIKTGYTRASGFNLASSVRADGKHVIAVLFGGVTATTRNAHMRSLLFRALQRASTEKTRRPEPLARTRPDLVAAKPEPQAPKQAARKAEPRAAARKTEPAPAAKAPAEREAARERESAPAPQIDVARVRPVTIARDTASPAPESEAAPPTQADVPTVPKLDLMALREAISSRSESAEGPGTPFAVAPARPESIEDIIAGAPQDATSAARPPSTLDRQAMALAAATQDAEPPRTSAPAPVRHARASVPDSETPAAPVAEGGFEIQIGAYASEAEAENRISTAKARASRFLDGHRGFTMPVRKGDRRIFRARFGGFDEKQASDTCLELRRLAIDCFVMKSN